MYKQLIHNRIFGMVLGVALALSVALCSTPTSYVAASAAGSWAKPNSGPSAPRDLGILGGAFSFATGISPAGAVVGDICGLTGGCGAFVYQNGTRTSLGALPGGNHSYATGINTAGAIVGYAETGSGAYLRAAHAYVSQNGATTDP